MGSFKPSRFVRAESDQQVLGLIEEYGDRARIVGGNTFLNELSKRGLMSSVEVLVDIEKLRLHYVREDDGLLRIGGSTTISEVSSDSSVKSEKWLRALNLAAAEVHPVQVRNVATMAGCISTGIPFLDVPCALLALDAQVKLVTIDGGRTVGIGDYLERSLEYTSKGFVEEVTIKKPAARASSSFTKFGITGFDYAMVNVAVAIATEESGNVSTAAIAVGGKNVELARLEGSENLLLSRPLSANTILEAAEIASKLAKASDDIPLRGSEGYKRRLIKVLVGRTLKDAAGVTA